MTDATMKNLDERQLHLLSILFYVLAAMSGLTGCIIMGFALLGVAVMAGMIEGLPQELAIFLGLVLIIIESALAFFVWIMSLLELLTGRSLASHSRYRLCMVMACIELLNFPFGTALAIFTIIVLSRPSVIALYEGRSHRDPRLEALAEFEDHEAHMPPKQPKGPDDGTIRAGTPE